MKENTDRRYLYSLAAQFKFATAINCIDGRVQLPVIDWFMETYGVDYLDMITEPGPEYVLASNIDRATVNSIKKRVHISLDKHDSGVIAIVGHADCAANASRETVKKDQIQAAAELVRRWDLGVPVIGLFVSSEGSVDEVLDKSISALRE